MTSVAATQDCWTGTQWWGDEMYFAYAKIILMQAVPLAFEFTWPNVISGATGWGGDTCVSLYSSVTMMGVRMKFATTLWKMWWSLTNWLANDMDDFTFWGEEFGDDMEHGWWNAGALWQGRWTWVNYCFA